MYDVDYFPDPEFIPGIILCKLCGLQTGRMHAAARTVTLPGQFWLFFLPTPFCGPNVLLDIGKIRVRYFGRCFHRDVNRKVICGLCWQQNC